MNLVVGSTGLLGSAVCLKLAKAGKPVLGMVRDLNSEKARALAGAGVNLIAGDLKDPASLRRAAADAETIVCTASSTLSRREGDSIESVDHVGVQSLIDAAEQCGVKRFIFVSYESGNDDSPLSRAKQEAEARLKHSKLDWTILQPGLFCEVWLSPALGFDANEGKVRIYGEGDRNVSYIAVDDVANAIVACVDNPKASRQVFVLGGPTPTSQLDAVHTFERATGRTFTIERMTIEAIKAARAKATDPLTKSFYSLMQHAAEGFPTDPRALTQLGVKARSLEEWVQSKT